MSKTGYVKIASRLVTVARSCFFIQGYNENLFSRMAKDCIHQTLRFFSKDLEDLIPNCKLSWPHSASEDNTNIPPIFFFFLYCMHIAH
jgi:hypothetical protein